MCGGYYNQWDADDLRDWMDKQPEDDDVDREPEDVDVHDCGCCMRCLGLRTSDFY